MITFWTLLKAFGQRDLWSSVEALLCISCLQRPHHTAWLSRFSISLPPWLPKVEAAQLIDCKRLSIEKWMEVIFERPLISPSPVFVYQIIQKLYTGPRFSYFLCWRFHNITQSFSDCLTASLSFIRSLSHTLYSFCQLPHLYKTRFLLIFSKLRCLFLPWT